MTIKEVLICTLLPNNLLAASGNTVFRVSMLNLDIWSIWSTILVSFIYAVLTHLYTEFSCCNSDAFLLTIVCLLSLCQIMLLFIDSIISTSAWSSLSRRLSIACTLLVLSSFEAFAFHSNSTSLFVSLALEVQLEVFGVDWNSTDAFCSGYEDTYRVLSTEYCLPS